MEERDQELRRIEQTRPRLTRKKYAKGWDYYALRCSVCSSRIPDENAPNVQRHFIYIVCSRPCKAHIERHVPRDGCHEDVADEPAWCSMCATTRLLLEKRAATSQQQTLLAYGGARKL